MRVPVYIYREVRIMNAVPPDLTLVGSGVLTDEALKPSGYPQLPYQREVFAPRDKPRWLLTVQSTENLEAALDLIKE
jgi:hypothetical protein